jgi:hypothetical protein
LNQSVSQVGLADDVVEFQSKMIEGTIAIGTPTLPASGITVNSSSFTTPDDSTGITYRSVYTGDMSEGMLVAFTNEIETREIFNSSYAFELERRLNSSTWRLTRVQDREKGVKALTGKGHFQQGNRIRYLNWKRIVTDPSFKVDSVDSNASSGPAVTFKFSCSVSDRPDFAIHGGSATVNPEQQWRLENYSVAATYAGGEKATLRGKNTYYEDERIATTSSANFITGNNGKFGRNEIEYLFEVSPDVFRDTAELYYLADYGLPEPPGKGGSFFSWKLATAVLLLLVAVLGFWYARR